MKTKGERTVPKAENEKTNRSGKGQRRERHSNYIPTSAAKRIHVGLGYYPFSGSTVSAKRTTTMRALRGTEAGCLVRE